MRRKAWKGMGYAILERQTCQYKGGADTGCTEVHMEGGSFCSEDELTWIYFTVFSMMHGIVLRQPTSGWMEIVALLATLAHLITVR